MTDNTPYQPITVFLNSKEYTQQLNSSDYIFELNRPILTKSNVDILVSLQSFKFTNSLYTINNSNQNFYYYYSLDLYKIVIPIGNYNVNSLIQKLNSLTTNFTFSYDPLTYHVTILSVDPLVRFLLYAGHNHCFNVLGIDTTLNNYIYQISYTSNQAINLMPTQVLYITIPNIGLKSIGAKGARLFNIIDCIHITAGKGEAELYLNTNTFKFKFNDIAIPFLHIQILDENYNVVDFNGITWYMKLGFEFTYRNALILPPTLTNSNNDYMEQYIKAEEKRNYDKLLDDIINHKKKISK